MQKFNFKLDSVLKLKVQMEDNAKNNLAGATRTLAKHQEYLEELKSEKETSINNLNSQSDSGISVYVIKNYNNYFSFLKGKIVNQKENVNNAQKDVDHNRELLVKAVQERKILDKLKEKQYQEYLKDQGRAEQGLIDELNSFKFKEGSGEDNARD